MNKKRSKKIQKKYDERKKNAKIASILEEQFQQGKLLGESLGALVWVRMRESVNSARTDAVLAPGIMSQDKLCLQAVIKLTAS